ncbi:Uncharacterised protein [Legionella steigerwaltii]|uniref:Ankyrin repeat-containing protein n=1 Tax=Legionella steigerwaltii TaxID=460 RepID=A0A378L6M6_9GAMM|nr:hypothetical protein [Legionella steigerwaltii]KTD77024.1 hypothetical protein Lstg_2267 [Legionella steigerwaltii]STY22453.1 Uncharacterised protein [Legionella steigerwaltii]
MAQESHIREPESGWDLRLTSHYAQLNYYFNSSNLAFQKIIITTKGNNKFKIDFQKPKEPLGFEKCLEKFGFQYDEFDKKFMDYKILNIELQQLREALNLLHKQNYISEQILRDIELAISPDNPDLMKLKKAKEEDSTRPTMIFENERSRQNSLNENLYVFCANENMRLYTMKDITSAGIFVIRNLLKNNANPNSYMNSQTPLMGLIINQPCNDDTKQIASLLLEYNAQLNAHDMNYRTAIFLSPSLGVYFLLLTGVFLFVLHSAFRCL